MCHGNTQRLAIQDTSDIGYKDLFLNYQRSERHKSNPSPRGEPGGQEYVLHGVTSTKLKDLSSLPDLYSLYPFPILKGFFSEG